MINRMAQLGGSSNPNLLLETGRTSPPQKKFTPPTPTGVCVPNCTRYQLQGVIVKSQV